jgi:hypothetical protein
MFGLSHLTGLTVKKLNPTRGAFCISTAPMENVDAVFLDRVDESGAILNLKCAVSLDLKCRHECTS